MTKSKFFLITVAVIFLAGTVFVMARKQAEGPVACTMEAKICPDGTAVGRTGPNCEFTECPTGIPQAIVFGIEYTLKVDAPITFLDGLNISLKKINDSRCKEGVQCIWAGELNPVIHAWGGTLGERVEEVRLGTTTERSAKITGYTFVLHDATENTALITVIKN